ncbi:MAG: nucleotidyltransferase domain-containing protein [Anaerolineae bacterium]|nr:nucleotidyltransferase domain-containing protein [Anaerolineae bacterium]
MNLATQQFVENLRVRDEVLGVILFGSWARGNHREDSDVDLLVILRDGFLRTVEVHAGQVFEVTYTTEQGASDFWHANQDDAIELWRVARVLFDRDGTVERLRAIGEQIRAKGKTPLSKAQYSHIKFDVFDGIKAAKAHARHDPATARLLLNFKVMQMTEQFFDVHVLWTPPPKQRLAVIKQHHAMLHERFVAFYDEMALTAQIEIARQIADLVFDDDLIQLAQNRQA